MTQLDRLLAAADRRDRPADEVGSAAAAAIELLWWHDRFDDAQHLAESVLTDFADQPQSTLYQRDLPLSDALLAPADWRGDNPVPELTAVLRRIPLDTVLGKHLAWMVAERPHRKPFELLAGYHWGRAPLPFKRRDQELADRPPNELTDTERERLYSASHNRRQFDAAYRLFTDTGQHPLRWYVAVWMAGELTQRRQTELATAFLLAALPDWIPFDAADIMPTEIVLQPRTRPAITDELRDRILHAVDITHIPGITP